MRLGEGAGGGVGDGVVRVGVGGRWAGSGRGGLQLPHELAHLRCGCV